MLADIASGNVDAADVFFLIAVILTAVAALLYAAGNRSVRGDSARVVTSAVWAPVAAWLGVAFAALGWLVL